MCAEAFVGTGLSEGMTSGLEVEGQRKVAGEALYLISRAITQLPKSRVLDMSRRDQFSASCSLTADRLESTRPGCTERPPSQLQDITGDHQRR